MEIDLPSNISTLTYDTVVKSFLQNILEGEGYKITYCDDEDSLLQNLTANQSSLILLDVDGTNAFTLCKKIRTNFSLRCIPIILLINKELTVEKIKGIYAGADDYIEKPIAAAELLTRVKAAIWRAIRDLEANPLTKLPGNVSILKELEKRIKNNDSFCVGYADLTNFKEFNDCYGFEWGDNVIKQVASIITGAIYEVGTPNDFLGHIGGDDFIFITDWECIKQLCEKIVHDFDKAILSFYKKEDLEKGYIRVKNREGALTSIPIAKISIGVSTNKARQMTHVGEIIQIITELKNYAKTFPKSIYIIDRRQT